MSGGPVTVRKIPDLSAFRGQIDAAEADADFLTAVSGNAAGAEAVFAGTAAVGAALALSGRQAFLYVYIFPAYRGRGYGGAAAAALEERLCASRPGSITACWRSGDAAALALAGRCGYPRKFSSAYMLYGGPPFPEEDLAVREYRDSDYPEAHALYAEAFHLMRLGTGCFPDSVPEAPGDRMRRNWAATAGDRLVCLRDGGLAGYAHVEGGEIGSVAIKAALQGRGLGGKFVRVLVNRVLAGGRRQVSLTCVEGNERARRLYDGLGFAEAYRNDYGVKELLRG